MTSGLLTDMADKCGLKEKSTKVQHFISHFQDEKKVRAVLFFKSEESQNY